MGEWEGFRWLGGERGPESRFYKEKKRQRRKEENKKDFKEREKGFEILLEVFICITYVCM